MTIKNIIFDLGGVLIDIDFDKTFAAYERISGENRQNIKESQTLYNTYIDYELGKINSAEFRDNIKKGLKINTDDTIIDNAWNALLLDFNPTAINLINRLKPNYTIGLLSNTNEIHFSRCNSKIREQKLSENLISLFDNLFLSYEIGLRKPSPSIYQHVIKHLKCQPQEILFIDDLKENIESAQKTGMKTIHLINNKTIADLVLKEIN